MILQRYIDLISLGSTLKRAVLSGKLGVRVSNLSQISLALTLILQPLASSFPSFFLLLSCSISFFVHSYAQLCEADCTIMLNLSMFFHVAHNQNIDRSAQAYKLPISIPFSKATLFTSNSCFFFSPRTFWSAPKMFPFVTTFVRAI